MSTIELVFEGQTFEIARRSLAATCELFAENLRLLEKPDRELDRELIAYWATNKIA
jgi:hypothetical protein